MSFSYTARGVKYILVVWKATSFWNTCTIFTSMHFTAKHGFASFLLHTIVVSRLISLYL